MLPQVRAYSKVFWKRHKDINDWEKHIKNIEGGEARIQRQTDIMNAIASKMNRYKNPHQVGAGGCALTALFKRLLPDGQNVLPAFVARLLQQHAAGCPASSFSGSKC